MIQEVTAFYNQHHHQISTNQKVRHLPLKQVKSILNHGLKLKKTKYLYRIRAKKIRLEIKTQIRDIILNNQSSLKLRYEWTETSLTCMIVSVQRRIITLNNKVQIHVSTLTPFICTNNGYKQFDQSSS